MRIIVSNDNINGAPSSVLTAPVGVPKAREAIGSLDWESRSSLLLLCLYCMCYLYCFCSLNAPSYLCMRMHIYIGEKQNRANINKQEGKWITYVFICIQVNWKIGSCAVVLTCLKKRKNRSRFKWCAGCVCRNTVYWAIVRLRWCPSAESKLPW
jgi:hypothetical protein